jgi:hypothetical protein
LVSPRDGERSLDRSPLHLGREPVRVALDDDGVGAERRWEELSFPLAELQRLGVVRGSPLPSAGR